MLQSVLKQMYKLTFLILPVIVFTCLSGCDRQSATQATSNGKQTTTQIHDREQAEQLISDELPDWSLAVAEADSLGAFYKMSSFEFRPPADFRFIKYIPESKTYYWVGPIRTDETYPQLMVSISELPASDANSSLSTLLSDVMVAIKQRRTNWIETPAQQGKINELSFVRCSWSGEASTAARAGLSGRMMHGIVYVAVHNNQAIQIMCQDVAPDHVEPLKLAGFAALTFRVAPEKTTQP